MLTEGGAQEERSFAKGEAPAFEDAYRAGKIHPGDLKAVVAEKINEIIAPVRKHFEEDAAAKELLKKVRGYKTTR